MKLLTTKQVTEVINRSSTTLYRWWKIEKRFPMPILHNGKAVAWNKEDVKQWLESSRDR